jgi:hypothetical protein
MLIKDGKRAEYDKYVQMNSNDGYSKGVVDFAEKWATLMEAEIEKGAKIPDIAKATSSEADMGITGFMYGCAVQALAHFWEYGEELRRWSNLDIQIKDEGEKANESGGVLNPALLSLG